MPHFPVEMLNRLRLRRDPTLYAPSYAVLGGILLSTAFGFAVAPSLTVRATAQMVMGVAAVLLGLHAILYRHEHTGVWRDRLRLAAYRPYHFLITGGGMIFVGLIFALVAYSELIRPPS